MLQRILAPVDDPSETRVAIDLALALAAPLDAEVTLLHVIDPEGSADASPAEIRRSDRRTDTGLSARPLDPLTSTGNPRIEDEDTVAARPTGTASGDAGMVEAEPLPDEEAEAARHVLERIAAENAHSDVPVAVAVTRGNPAAQILSMAHTARFDLIVMETRRSSAMARMVMGSTADEVARQSQVPVMLINPRGGDTHATPVAAPQDIIVPLDRSDESEHVIPLAQEMARRLQARAIFVHVQASGTDAAASGEGDAATYLQQFVSASREKGLEADAEVMHGDPMSAISGVVDALSNPLIVLDASGKSKLHRLLAGSLPDQLVRKSGAPVLIAPEKLGAAIA